MGSEPTGRVDGFIGEELLEEVVSSIDRSSRVTSDINHQPLLAILSSLLDELGCVG